MVMLTLYHKLCNLFKYQPMLISNYNIFKQALPKANLKICWLSGYQPRILGWVGREERFVFTSKLFRAIGL